MVKTIEQAERELALINLEFEKVDARIREFGGAELKFWLFQLKYKIHSLENQIRDLKNKKIRSNKKMGPEITLEKRVALLDKNVQDLRPGNAKGVREETKGKSRD